MNGIMVMTVRKIMIEHQVCICIDCRTDRVLKELQNAAFVRGNSQQAIYDAMDLITYLTGREIEEDEAF